MNCINVDEAVAKVDEYLSNNSAYPFFIAVDDSDSYKKLLKTFSTFKKINVSSYCAADGFPDFDRLCSDLIEGASKRILVGLGDSIALSGQARVLSRIKDCILSGKVIALCRGITSPLLKQSEIDHKFNSRRFCVIKSVLDYSVISINPGLAFNGYHGFKSLLSALENGANGKIYVGTDLKIEACKRLESSYDAILENLNNFSIPRLALEDSYWDEYLKDPRLEGFDILHWRTYLKLLMQKPETGYMGLVLSLSTNYSSYKDNLISALLEISCSDKNFWALYKERKEIVKSLQKSEIARYVALTEQKSEERNYYLTNNTECERFAIIKEIARQKRIPNEINTIYPEIHEYLTKYFFRCDNAEEITAYFEHYKMQKVFNEINPDFLQHVISYASDGQRIYTRFSTRGAILEKLDDGKTSLFWIDALGVEYLGYIQVKAKELGLKLNIQVARAQLPTLTSINRQFYDEWKGKKNETKKLDNIKHDGDQSFNYETEKYPIHLAAELTVLDQTLNWAKTELLNGATQRVVVTSDHGASRLAVIANSELKLSMSSKGEHSGRCCPINDIDEKPDIASEENGYWVLATYDRFKGGRKASVEVHGGASLEEVLVPVIQLSLANPEITLKTVTPEIYSSWNENPRLEIYCSEKVDSLLMKFNGKIYKSEKKNDAIYVFTISDFKKSGSYKAEIFDEDTLLGQVSFRIEKRSGKTDSEFEDEFFK